MFGSQILDIAIAMIFFYLFLSLVCSAIREGIEAWTKVRAMNMERGIRELLADNSGTGIVTDLFNHPSIASLFPGKYDPEKLRPANFGGGTATDQKDMRREGRKNLPSYIPSGNFASALVQVVTRGATAAQNLSKTAPADTDPIDLTKLRDAVKTFPNAHVQQALLTAIDRANEDLEQVHNNIADWYDSAMDRVSGWYKRRTQLILFVLGVTAAAFLNLDSFSMLDMVSTNQTLRAGLVAAAKTAEADRDKPEVMKSIANDIQGMKLPMGWRVNRTDGFPWLQPLPQSEEINCVKNSKSQMESTCIGLRSKFNERDGALATLDICQGKKKPDQGKKSPDKAHCNAAQKAADQLKDYPTSPIIYAPLSLIDWIKIIVGWIVTGAAVTLGAPFWFDTLSKFMTVRSALKPEAKTPEEKPAGAPAPKPPASTASPPKFDANEWTNNPDPQAGVL